jgi:hypothetical protein
MTETKIRYGAGGVPYVEKTIETEKADLEASYKQSIANKKERTKKKKKKVIQEIMGDDLKEQKETLDEII